MAQALVPAASALVPMHRNSGAETSLGAAGTSACATYVRECARQLHYKFVLDSRRRLPHHYPVGKWLFVTCHLHGTLPHARYPPPGKTDGEAFVWMDRYLDTTRVGPMYLRQEPVAAAVLTCLERGVQLGHYDLGAWVLMANHIHVLLFPHIPPPHLLRSLKGSSAREANRILGRTGQPFWQAESYDRWVRDEAEFGRIVRYIDNNPVKAGVVVRPEDYRWSSVAQALVPAASALVPMHGNSRAETSLGAAGTSAWAKKVH